MYRKNSIAGSLKKNSPKPTFELSEAQIEKLKSYGQVVLAILALASVLTVAAVAPGAIGALRPFLKLKGRKRMDYDKSISKVNKTFYYLRRKGYIKFHFQAGQYRIILTKKGKEKIKELSFNTIYIPKPTSWDGKFWQVAADIPTKYRIGADAFRRKIKELGFFALQRTLWFHPFDPRKEIEFVADFFGIASFVTVMKIDKFDPADEKLMKDYFQKNNIV